jgi:hypothetical protein
VRLVEREQRDPRDRADRLLVGQLLGAEHHEVDLPGPQARQPGGAVGLVLRGVEQDGPHRLTGRLAPLAERGDLIALQRDQW